ncbi:hypothetical protein HX109_04950 [Galbibacter sp. BG1]|uniref:hypothetical protein n=1 Tax=Galbibacter sp. BG1 TaxID=1170699 RepID=UPI0015BE5C2F|nr:hypothetical protein [Galbibacter sp. BG1]QLE00943.1 hypothetical protein HX109_04950 [Galbibacter sp. BG1]
MENKNLVVLEAEELQEINGGHKGFSYYAGVLVASSVLRTLGILTGISEGLSETI